MLGACKSKDRFTIAISLFVQRRYRFQTLSRVIKNTADRFRPEVSARSCRARKCRRRRAALRRKSDAGPARRTRNCADEAARLEKADETKRGEAADFHR